MRFLAIPVWCPLCGGELVPVAVGVPVGRETSAVTYCAGCEREVHYCVAAHIIAGKAKPPPVAVPA